MQYMCLWYFVKFLLKSYCKSLLIFAKPKVPVRAWSSYLHYKKGIKEVLIATIGTSCFIIAIPWTICGHIVSIKTVK